MLNESNVCSMISILKWKKFFTTCWENSQMPNLIFCHKWRSHYWHLHNFKHGKSFLRWSSVFFLFFRGLFGSNQVRDNIVSFDFFSTHKMENERVSHGYHWVHVWNINYFSIQVRNTSFYFTERSRAHNCCDYNLGTSFNFVQQISIYA